MNYQQAVSYLEDRKKLGMALGLDRVRALLSALGNPHKQFKSILVAGTNGKGSVVAMLSAAITASGIKTGAYTSPHLLYYTERVRINDADVGREEFAEAISKVSVVLERRDESIGHPTVFEIITAAAFLIFAGREVELALLEVGLGGRLDATNVVEPIISVITNVGLEHKEILGGTIENIAGEKAGVIRPGVPVVTSAEGRALDVIKAVSSERGAPLYSACAKENSPLIGKHQRANFGVVNETVDVLGKMGYTVGVRDGVRGVRWPGRFDVVSGKPLIILDGAHNPGGAAALADSLKEYGYKMPLTIILGVLKDKDISGMIRFLAPLADRIIATKSTHERAAGPEAIESEAKKYLNDVVVEKSVEGALERALEKGLEQTILVCGSLFTVAEAHLLLTRERALR
jgi:dihydrofolate synthase/folylpolyglutamate synthase